MGRHWNNPYDCLHHTDCGKNGFFHLYCDTWNPDRQSIFGYNLLKAIYYQNTVQILNCTPF